MTSTNSDHATPGDPNISAPQKSWHGPMAVFVAFITLGVVYGVWFAYSVFMLALVEDMGWSRSLTAGAISVMSVVHGLSGPMNGRLIEKFGAQRVIALGGLLFALGMLLSSQVQTWWQLYITFGVISAIGIAQAGWVPFIVTVERWYPTKLGTALGFAMAGIGFGILVGVPAINALIEAYGWRQTFMFLAALGPLWVIPAALFLLKMPKQAPAKKSSTAPASATASVPNEPLYRDWVLKTALRSPRFWLAGACFLTGACVAQILLMHQFAFMVDQGIAKTESSFIAGVIGISSIVGQLFWGNLSDRIGRERAYTMAGVCNFLAIGALVYLSSMLALWVAVSFAIFVGLGYGANTPIFPATSRDLFTSPFFPSIFGTLAISGSLGAAIGAWLGGWLYDVTGGYSAMLVVSAVLAVVSPLLLWMAGPRLPNPAPHE
ncbi:MAG: MFS transporter [Candidatus Reddybacter sp.]